MTDFHHITVMQRELVAGLRLSPGAKAIDGTAGGGGHTQGLLEAVGPDGLVIAIDQDPMAIQALTQRFPADLARGTLRIVKARFSQVHAIAEAHGILGQVNGICADIGVSSPQLDKAERGFSFQADGPLDMRMDTVHNPRTAKDLIAEESLEELTRIFKVYGEEPKAYYVAKAIVKKRAEAPIETTRALADLVKGALHYNSPSKKHPATKVFQALRIAVNAELDELSQLIADGFTVLKPGGRLGIISFHSLEDRIVKHGFKDLAGQKDEDDPFKGLPLRAAEVQALKRARGAIIKPFPVEPSDDEIAANPRSRSAKLRLIEKNPLA